MSTEVIASTSNAFHEDVVIKTEPKEELEEKPDVVRNEDVAEAATEQSTNEVIKDKPPPKIPFNCGNCTFSELCDYKGCEPPFSRKIRFHEDCYVMKDPFSPPPGRLTNKSDGEYFIVIGAYCTRCSQSVCAESTCSIFYAKTFCLTCAIETIQNFPLEIQRKIRKLAADKSQ